MRKRTRSWTAAEAAQAKLAACFPQLFSNGAINPMKEVIPLGAVLIESGACNGSSPNCS